MIKKYGIFARRLPEVCSLCAKRNGCRAGSRSPRIRFSSIASPKVSHAHTKPLEENKVRQLVRLLGAKLEQGVERHVGEDLQEVTDYRYFKITVIVDGRELKL